MRSRSRMALLMMTLVGVMVIWSTASVNSPLEGWFVRAHLAYLRATSVPPCRSDSLEIMDCGGVRIPYPECWYGWLHSPDGPRHDCSAPTAQDDDILFLRFADPYSEFEVLVTVYHPYEPESVREWYIRSATLTERGWYVSRRDGRARVRNSQHGVEAHGEQVSVRIDAVYPSYLEDSHSVEALILSIEQLLAGFIEMNDAAEATLLQETPG